MSASSRHAPRPLRQDNRRHKKRLTVIRNNGPTMRWHSIDVSDGGCFVAGHPLLAAGAQLEVTLALDNEHELKTRALVAWVNHDGRADAPHLPTGMGLQFLWTCARAQAQLRGHLEATDGLDAQLAMALATEREEILDLAGLEIHEEASPPKQPPAPPASLGPDPSPTKPELGNYRLLRLIGSGGMGNVYLAEHKVLGRKVAVKTLHSSLAHDPTLIARFFDEARAVNQINHDNIVQVTDFASEGQVNYFVMEYLEGSSLGEEQARGPMKLDRATGIAEQLAGALSAAHDAGITHRDLKPDNVLLVTKNGRPDRVKLVDFGIAKLTDSVQAGKTATGMLLGTPGYIAPEQILGRPADHRADIYAFGVLLYQMVTGQKPFVADTWPELLVKHTTQPPPVPRLDGTILPPRLIQLIMRCLAKAPEDRPQSMHEVCDELALQRLDPVPPIAYPPARAFQTAAAVVAAPRRRPAPPARPTATPTIARHRHPRYETLAALVAAAVGACALWLTWPSPASPNPKAASAEGQVGARR